VINPQGLLRSRRVFAPILLIAAIALAGCSSGGSGSAAPSWAKALGAGATVYPPQSEVPGHSQPGQAIMGELAALKAKNLAGACAYMDPQALATCKSEASQVPPSMDSQLPYFTNAALGYVVVDGAKALVGTTGTFCSPGNTPKCFTNTKPAAIFSAGDKSFSQLWSDAVGDNSTNTYTLAPVVLVSGRWYVDGS
jgi:hypothetical protein